MVEEEKQDYEKGNILIQEENTDSIVTENITFDQDQDHKKQQKFTKRKSDNLATIKISDDQVENESKEQSSESFGSSSGDEFADSVLPLGFAPIKVEKEPIGNGLILQQSMPSTESELE